MARDASKSQASSASSAHPRLMATRRSPVPDAGMRCRRVGSGGGSSSVSFCSSSIDGSSNILRFYTDDLSGLKIGPTVVLIMSLCFIGFVTEVHVIGNLYRIKFGP